MSYITPEDLTVLGYTDLTDIAETASEICALASSLADAEMQQTLSPTAETQCVRMFNSVQNTMLKVFADFLPVISVSKIEYYDGGATLREITSGFIIDNDCGVINVPKVAYDSSLPVKMTYQHGYATIPEAVKAATLEIARAYIENIKATKLTGIAGVKSISDGGRSISYNTAAEFAIPQGVKAALQAYRRVR